MEKTTRGIGDMIKLFGKKRTKLESIEVTLNIPYLGGIRGTWLPNDAEKKAAWELYVELVTRISVVELKNGEGILREALNSLYSIFQTTREILRWYGADVAVPRKEGELSFGLLAIKILNYQLRPVLSKWHPLLADYEEQKKSGISIKAHEDKWEYNQELRDELNRTREVLIQYSKYLAQVANVEPLYIEKEQVKKDGSKKA